MPDLENYWFAERTGLPGPILVNGHSVVAKGEEHLSSLSVRLQG